jgi:integrase
MSVIKNERIKHRVRKHILTIEEARQLIMRTKKKRTFIWDYRDHVIVYLMITTGLKSVEIRKAKRSQLKKVKGQLILTITEGEFVKLTPKVESALNDYLMKRDDDNPYLFISHKQVSKDGHLSRLFFMDMFPRVLKTAGLEHTNITPHCLRHTAATLNLLSGGSIGQTKALMRHKEVKSTLVYVEYINRLKDDSEHQIEQFILKENHRVYPHQVIILE